MQIIETFRDSATKRERVRLICDCGREFETNHKDVKNGKTKSCGGCKLFRWQNSPNQIGKLTFIGEKSEVRSLTQKGDWKCECGGLISSPIVSVINLRTKSCGCSTIFTIKSNRPVREKKSEPEIFELITNSEVGNFVFIGESKTINSNSGSLEKFRCKCGKECLLRTREVISGYKKTCGKCKLIKLEGKFGKLTPVEPIEVKTGAEVFLDFKCDCGRQVKKSVRSVTLGLTQSCGDCSWISREWYQENYEWLKSVEYPISQHEPRIQIFSPKSDILNGSQYVDSICPICQNPHIIQFKYIKSGTCMTCGCTSGKISRPQAEIASELRKSGISVELEFSLSGRKFDIGIPDKKLLIEFHGLRWHSNPEARKRDFSKYIIAQENEFELIAIFEDEWRKSKEKVLSLIKNRLGLNRPRSLRPSLCEFKKVDVKEADEFFEKNHYIGKAKSRINYGGFFEGKLISLISFKRPTRQSSYDWELVRMASDSDFRIHGVWSKLLKMFVEEMKPISIVSFSDNRLFSGKVYEKIGFKFSGDVVPDYYWTKGKNRFHKSGLRKPPGEIKTEAEIREAEGYRKIYDLGKIRWIYMPSSSTTFEENPSGIESKIS